MRIMSTTVLQPETGTGSGRAPGSDGAQLRKLGVSTVRGLALGARASGPRSRKAQESSDRDFREAQSMSQKFCLGGGGPAIRRFAARAADP